MTDFLLFFLRLLAPHRIIVMEHDDIADDLHLFSCAICGLSEGDSSNLTTQNTLQTNATVGCGHQLYVVCSIIVSPLRALLCLVAAYDLY